MPGSSFASISARRESKTTWAPAPSSSTPMGRPRALARTNSPSRGIWVWKTISGGSNWRSAAAASVLSARSFWTIVRQTPSTLSRGFITRRRLRPSSSFGTERMPSGSACWGIMIASLEAMTSPVTPNKPGGGIDQAQVESAGGDAAEKGADAGEVGAHAAAAGFVVAGLAAGHQREGFQAGGHDQAVERDPGICQVVVKSGEQARLAGEGKPDGALGIRIDKQGFHPGAGEGMGEVDRDGGFTHSSFLAGNGDTDHTGLGNCCAKVASACHIGSLFFKMRVSRDVDDPFPLLSHYP